MSRGEEVGGPGVGWYDMSRIDTPAMCAPRRTRGGGADIVRG